jgi:hypothetical protein
MHPPHCRLEADQCDALLLPGMITLSGAIAPSRIHVLALSVVGAW